ncbi:MAG: glycoside hydrolase family 18 [Candidatus Cryptobacteroides sp.]
MKNSGIFTIVMAASVLVSCSKWTEPESVEIRKPSMTSEEGYETYVNALADYKAGRHKVVMASVENPSGRRASTKSERLTALPDSVDIAILQNPADLCEDYLAEMEAVRKLGTKILYRIPGPVEEDMPSLKDMLSLYERYAYDGIVFDYNSPSNAGLGKAELEEIRSAEDGFWDEVEEWHSSHGNALLMFAGKPQYLLDPSILSFMEYIIIDGTGASSISGLLKDISLALPKDDGYSSDKFIVEVNAPTPALFVENGVDEQGYFWNYKGDKRMTAIEGAAKCALTVSDQFSIMGVMVRDAQNDYYHQGENFINIRRAVTIMNPTPLGR